MYAIRSYYDYLEGDPVILKQIFLDILSSIETMNSERITRVTLNLSKEVKKGTNESISFRNNFV